MPPGIYSLNTCLVLFGRWVIASSRRMCKIIGYGSTEVGNNQIYSHTRSVVVVYRRHGLHCVLQQCLLWYNTDLRITSTILNKIVWGLVGHMLRYNFFSILDSALCAGAFLTKNFKLRLYFHRTAIRKVQNARGP